RSAGQTPRHPFVEHAESATVSDSGRSRSEEHTSELQSRFDLVCRLLLEKKKKMKSVAALSSVHSKQVLTQLRFSVLKLGLLINFGEAHLKNGIRRISHGHL